MLDFTLSEEQLAMQRLAREFAEKEIRPVVGEFEKDEEGKLAKQIVKKAAEIGILGLPIPEQYGGSGAKNLDCAIVMEEIAAGCGGIATVIGSSWFGQTPIMLAANSEQRQRWLPPLASNEGNLCCMAMTEPAGGSDIENPHMHAKTIRVILKEDGNDYVINGTKIWPSNSDRAFLYTVVATVDSKLGEAGSCIIVVPHDSPGLSFGKPIKKMGMDADHCGEIFFDDARVPKENLLGKVGDGVKILERTLIYNRAATGALSVGMARGAFEIALKYAKERVVGDKLLIEHEIIAAMFADMATEIDAARLLTWRATWFNTQGQPNMAWSSMAKVYASDISMKVASNAIQVMGSYGYSREVGVEKYMRDAKIIQIYIGANELLRQQIGESL